MRLSAIFLLTRKGSEAGSQWTLLGRRILQLDVAGLHEKAALLPHDPELPHFDGSALRPLSSAAVSVPKSNPRNGRFQLQALPLAASLLDAAAASNPASWPRLGLKPASRGNPRSFPFRV